MDTSIFTDASVLDFGLFLAGCAAGYGWASRTVVKASNDRIAELKNELSNERTDRKEAEVRMQIRIQSLEDDRMNIALKSHSNSAKWDK